ncbi:hypothetical protein [Maribacter sp.]|uniref:hypothetical protein n=1 Tax=Maribacter sp. TaxID=1897614 RepID=UPI0025BBBD4F|nr:hypothetical protein [Maribacter sp.]
MATIRNNQVNYVVVAKENQGQLLETVLLEKPTETKIHETCGRVEKNLLSL